MCARSDSVSGPGKEPTSSLETAIPASPGQTVHQGGDHHTGYEESSESEDMAEVLIFKKIY